ncbi:MAG: hypothetical protein Q9162_006815 [Coniocarpon cinnabarinum]
MHLLALPDELFQDILEHLFSCNLHPNASIAAPCLAQHAPNQHQALTPLRLVNRFFDERLRPPIFRDISCKGKRRHENLPALSQSPQLASLVKTLKLDVCPRDFGPEWSEEIHGYPAGDRAEYYFDDLKKFLIPCLSQMQNIHTLYLATTYSGLHLAGKSRGDLLMPCFEALCDIVKEARLPMLEVIQVGVPYEGGYAGFFQNKGSKRVLEGIKGGCAEKDGVREWEVPRLRMASVKLSDYEDNFTVMDFMLGE